MNDDEFEEFEEFEDELPPIPKELYSEYEERPFRCCTRCGESLADFEEGYKISKVVKNGETIFEYALCFHCLEGIMEDSSEESRERLMRFQMERMREGVSGMEDCALCDNTRKSMKKPEFALEAGCQGLGVLEIRMICMPCMEEMSELVSKKTRDSWSRFVEENFPGVPVDFAPSPTEGAPAPVFL